MTGGVVQGRVAVSDLQLRLTTLDGLRGAAAVSVMIFHFVGLFRTGRSLPSAYLAVDMFFILSGFILSRLYETPLRAG